MPDFEEIYRSYFADVYRYALALSRDAHTAEEVTQETFVRALTAIDSFRGECQVRVWLCQIAKHLWYKELKKKEREKPAEITEETASFDHGPETAVIQKAEVLELYKRLHTLEEPLREVMYLRLNGNFSFKEIGEILGRDENWARVTFYRGKQRIRKELYYEM